MSGSGKILKRFFNKTKFTDDEWSELLKDFNNKSAKSYICSKYNIKTGYYKYLKKYFLGKSNE